MKISNLIFITFFLLLLAAACGTTRNGLTPYAEYRLRLAGKPPTDTFLSGLLGRYPLYFDSLLQPGSGRRVQIAYTRIDRTRSNYPQLTRYYYHVDSDTYFYPASTVKLPVAVLALQKLNAYPPPGIGRNTTMVTEAAYSGQTAVYNDPTSPDGRPTIAHYIKKIFLTSDNDAFNRLYEFLGHDYIHYSLHRIGYDSVQIRHRLAVSLTEEENRYTNPIRFYDTAGRLLHRQPGDRGNFAFGYRHNPMGRGYYLNGQLVEAPFDFSARNRLTLTDLHTLMENLFFPAAGDPKLRFNLREEDYRFLYHCMSALPRESDAPAYDTTYPDAHVKFLLYGGTGAMEPHIRIFNKAGAAYGFLTDAAYIIDTKNKVEFLLSATIHCNSDGIYNDDRYDYETVGFPFMKNLGRVIYEHELQRTRRHEPGFGAFLPQHRP